MSKLFLHIGHDKTGSSFLQSAFAASVDVLKNSNIVYPISPERKDQASKGFVSNGNIRDFITCMESGSFMGMGSDTFLFSSELFYAELSKPDFQKKFKNVVTGHDFSEVNVLLFVRDPVDHASSSYQQQVKGAGLTHSPEKFFAWWDVTKTILGLLDFLDSLPNAKVSIFNYSVDRKNILEISEEWLGLQKGTLVRPKALTVNRSLTRSELRLQLEINKCVGGRAGHLLSRPLCNKTPEIRSDNIRPTRAQQEQLWDRLSHSLEELNDRLPKHAHYDRARDIGEEPDAPESSDACFSTAQLRVIAEIISENAKEREKLAQKQRASKTMLHQLEARFPTWRNRRVRVTNFIRRRLS